LQTAPFSRVSLLRSACALPFVAAIVVGGCTTQNGPNEKLAQADNALTSRLASKMIMPVRRGPAPAAPNCSVPLKYYGGRVLDHVKVVQVLWGTGVETNVATKMGDYYKGVLNSTYMDWLGEYDTINVPAALKGPGTTTETKQHLGRGSFVKTVQITPSAANAGAAITDEQIATELKAQIDKGILPAPEADGNGGYRTLYMVDFPLTVGGATLRITGPNGDGSCSVFCAYHGATTYNGGNLAYGVHPDVSAGACANGCGQDPDAFKNATSVHSHEMIEAATDPDIGIFIAGGGATLAAPVGWYADGPQTETCGEIGDICNADQGLVGTFTVQTEWSNTAKACILAAAAAPPACVDAKGGACSPCTSDASCSGATPVCATDATDFKAGTCVACKDNTKCSGDTPTCDKSASAADDTCRACQADSECPTATPRCIGGSKPAGDAGTGTGGKCMECTVNDDCKASTKGPVCDTATNTCRGCTADTECTTGHCATAAADTNKGKCVQCTTDAQCTGGTVCDTAKDTCVGCKTNAQCKNPKPLCDTTAESCAVCTKNEDCAGAADGPECNKTAGTCGAVGTGGGSTTTTSSGCAVSGAGGSTGTTGLGFAGALVALGLVLRRRRAS
jgi:MYXO-CTERM domain-containing protein